MFARFIPMVIGLSLGSGASQFPEFAQQYTQRVGGAANELQSVVARFEKDANKHGLTIPEAIEQYTESPTPFIQDRGKSMQNAVTRASYLQSHYQAMTTDRPFGQLWNFSRNPDTAIAREALQDFKPAIPLTLEGLLHTLAGFILGFFGISMIGRLLFKRRNMSAQ